MKKLISILLSMALVTGCSAPSNNIANEQNNATQVTTTTDPMEDLSIKLDYEGGGNFEDEHNNKIYKVKTTSEGYVVEDYKGNKLYSTRSVKKLYFSNSSFISKNGYYIKRKRNLFSNRYYYYVEFDNKNNIDYSILVSIYWESKYNSFIKKDKKNEVIDNKTKDVKSKVKNKSDKDKINLKKVKPKENKNSLVDLRKKPIKKTKIKKTKNKKRR